jgi:hypothetical protein
MLMGHLLIRMHPRHLTRMPPQPIGRLMTIVLNLRRWNSYSHTIKCLQGRLIHFLTCGLLSCMVCNSYHDVYKDKVIRKVWHTILPPVTRLHSHFLFSLILFRVFLFVSMNFCLFLFFPGFSFSHLILPPSFEHVYKHVMWLGNDL